MGAGREEGAQGLTHKTHPLPGDTEQTEVGHPLVSRGARREMNSRLP